MTAACSSPLCDYTYLHVKAEDALRELKRSFVRKLNTAFTHCTF